MPPLIERARPTDSARGVPLLCAAEWGFAALTMEVRTANGWSDDHIELVHQIADDIRYRTAGALVGLLDLPDAPRPLILIQSNRGPWYSPRYPDDESIWPAFYEGTVAVGLVEGLRARGRPVTLLLEHPTGHRWLSGLAEAVAHGLATASESVEIARVALRGCCVEDVAGLAREISRADGRGPPLPLWRELPGRYGPGTRILQVDVAPRVVDLPLLVVPTVADQVFCPVCWAAVVDGDVTRLCAHVLHLAGDGDVEPVTTPRFIEAIRDPRAALISLPFEGSYGWLWRLVIEIPGEVVRGRSTMESGLALREAAEARLRAEV